MTCSYTGTTQTAAQKAIAENKTNFIVDVLAYEIKRVFSGEGLYSKFFISF